MRKPRLRQVFYSYKAIHLARGKVGVHTKVSRLLSRAFITVPHCLLGSWLHAGPGGSGMKGKEVPGRVRLKLQSMHHLREAREVL